MVKMATTTKTMTKTATTVETLANESNDFIVEWKRRDDS